MGEEETYPSFTQSDHPALVPSAQIECMGVEALENSPGLVRNGRKLIEKKLRRGGGNIPHLEDLGRSSADSFCRDQVYNFIRAGN